jgi:hypothetical protein
VEEISILDKIKNNKTKKEKIIGFIYQFEKDDFSILFRMVDKILEHMHLLRDFIYQNSNIKQKEQFKEAVASDSQLYNKINILSEEDPQVYHIVYEVFIESIFTHKRGFSATMHFFSEFLDLLHYFQSVNIKEIKEMLTYL